MEQESRVWSQLRDVLDPETGVSLVELGIVQSVAVMPGRVKIAIDATHPLAEHFAHEAATNPVGLHQDKRSLFCACHHGVSLGLFPRLARPEERRSCCFALTSDHDCCNPKSKEDSSHEEHCEDLESVGEHQNLNHPSCDPTDL